MTSMVLGDSIPNTKCECTFSLPRESTSVVHVYGLVYVSDIMQFIYTFVYCVRESV